MTGRIVAAGLSALAGILMASMAQAADDAERSDVGILTCNQIEGSGYNFLIHSKVDLKCVFEANDGRVEHYKGTTGMGLGLDFDVNRATTMTFAVAAASGSDLKSHALAGNYGGVKVSAAVGKGGGAGILVGGSSDHVALEPFAEEHKSGFGLAAGATWLSLDPASKPFE